jgi:hypothetical protein
VAQVPENLIAQQCRLLTARYRLRPSPSVHYRCPRIVAGKRHHPSRCVCEGWGYRLFDHGHMWLAPNGHHVLTGEPYAIESVDLGQLYSLAADLHLAVDLSPESFWYPPHTTFILVRRASDPAASLGR